MRYDNGKEYTSVEFDLFCEEAGIEHQLTAPYTPEQNGVSERRNKYVMEMARRMLQEKELPKIFWAEAANTLVFLQNRLPTKVLENKTPFEAWYGYKPSLRFLKVFGCVCFVYVPKINVTNSTRRQFQASSWVIVQFPKPTKSIIQKQERLQLLEMYTSMKMSNGIGKFTRSRWILTRSNR